MPPRSTPDPCAGCELASAPRRDFLRDAAALVGALALTATPVHAAGISLRFGAALFRRGSRAAYPIPAADGATIDKEHEVILVRSGGSVFAFALSCPHQNTALKWKEDQKRFECPKHHSKYQPDGTFISGRATRSMDRYAISREGEQVMVDLATLYQQDKDRAAWEQAVVKL